MTNKYEDKTNKSEYINRVSLINILMALAIALITWGIVAIGFDFFYDLNAVKPGEKLSESISPNGEYKITAYLNNGGATTDFAVLCQLDDGQHVKNIYWNYHCYSAEIVWEDDDTVIINGVLFENVEKDTYDFRRDK